MCRYADGQYSCRWACFSCRKAFKAHSAWEYAFGCSFHVEETRVCPECAGPTYDIGKDTRPPKKENKKQWKKLEVLQRAGWNFHTCGCNGPELPPTLNALKRKQTENISKKNPDGRGPYSIHPHWKNLGGKIDVS